MFGFTWFWNLLYQFGLVNKEATILILGLDNAGKTTLLQKLKDNTIRLVVPTQRPQLEELTVGSLNLRVFDLGHKQVRQFWKEYYGHADAIVFMVDSADRERFPEAKEELHALFDQNPIPILILSNKDDVEWACKEREVIEALDIGKPLISEGRSLKVGTIYRPWLTVMQMVSCSLVEGRGSNLFNGGEMTQITRNYTLEVHSLCWLKFLEKFVACLRIKTRAKVLERLLLVSASNGAHLSI
ncbi:GTP-binding protein SAR1 [Planoprotostelium fungivorum]|uniref:GTP-binding protein SAR1 n=1 Tax=Planoprotostelium fungivorum TaxID=1890364 RepID=A0A2P6NHZ0_9EUKA|nr:GTP-binding protein SAR1 [Planoprotostelium fungivorum]